MSAGGTYTSNRPESTTITIKPDAFNVGELDSGAHPTSTSVLTIPIPTGSSVVDMQVTFRDRRPAYDNESRTAEPIIVTRLELGSTISGWNSSDFTFAGRIWRRHERVFSLNGVPYTFRIYASFDPENFYLMFQGVHVGRSNVYGGWENLTVNYSEFEEISSLEEIEVEELVGSYLPTFSEGRSISLVTGIPMESPATHVRVQFTGASGYYELLLNLNSTVENVQGLPASSTTYHQTYTIPIRIEVSDAASGTLRNITNEVAAYSIIRRVDVYTRKKVKVLK